MTLEEKILEIAKNEHFKTVREEKIVDMLYALIIYKEKDLNRVSKIAGLSRKIVDKYINDESLMLKMIEKSEYIELLKIYKEIKIVQMEKDKVELNLLVKKVIDDIINSRETIDDIYEKNGISKEIITEVLKDKKYMEDNFGVGIVEKINEFKKQRNRLRDRKNEFVVREKRQVTILKDEITHLNEYDLKTMKMVARYLFSGADVDSMKKDLSLPYSVIITTISRSKLKEMMKESNYNELNRLLSYEKILSGQQIDLKTQLIKDTINELIKNNYDIKRTLQVLNIPYPLFKRIVNEALISTLFPHTIVDKIKLSFEVEENENVKRKTKIRKKI